MNRSRSFGTRAGVAAIALCFGFAAEADAQNQKRTTQTDNGVLHFSNTNCNGQTRFIALRAGGNTTDRDIIMMLSPGQNVKVGVSRGSTWRGSCGSMPRDEDTFAWIPLEEVY